MAFLKLLKKDNEDGKGSLCGFYGFVPARFPLFSVLFIRKSFDGNEKMLCFVRLTDFLFIFAHIFNYYRRTRCH